MEVLFFTEVKRWYGWRDTYLETVLTCSECVRVCGMRAIHRHEKFRLNVHVGLRKDCRGEGLKERFGEVCHMFCDL